MGKATLIMVIGLSLVLGMVGFNLSNRSTNALTNAENYYMDAARFSLKTSGANLAVARIFRDTAYVNAISIGGSVTYYSGAVNLKARGSGALEKVGDLYVTIGRPVRDSLIVTSACISQGYTYRGVAKPDSDTTYVGMRRTNFAEYAYFTDQEKNPSGTTIWWISGDSIGINVADTMNGGKVHTNDMMHIDGNPVFFGKVTTGKGFDTQSGSHPTFKGGYESGVYIDMPGDFNLLVQNEANAFYRNNNKDIYLDFYVTSGVGYMGYRYTSTGTDSVFNLTKTGFNGLVAINGADIHIQGVVDGSITVAAFQKTDGTKGNIWIDNDIVYNVDPRTNPTLANDYLGLVADNNVWVTDNTNNNANGVAIDASIMCREGSFGAQNYDSRIVNGTTSLRILGGVIQETRGAVGTFSNGKIKTGFNKVYSYDGRMATTYPPFFPMTKQFKIYTWWE